MTGPSEAEVQAPQRTTRGAERARRLKSRASPSPGPRRRASLLSRLRRGPVLALSSILAALALAALLAVAGLDAPSIALGGAVVAGAFAVLVVLAARPIRRAQRASERRQRKRDKRDRIQHARTRRVIVRTERSVRRSERRLYGQLEALGWLKDLLALEQPLPPTRGWAASPDLLLELVRIIDRTRPSVVLELGSGVSTIVMAARLKALAQGHLVALEHEPRFAEETRLGLRSQGLADYATVVDAPLTDVRIGESVSRWYQVPGAADISGIDLLLVDGPPADTAALARYPALPLLAAHLSPGATIVMDDADRPDEQEIARRWQAEYPGLRLKHLPLEVGAFILTMPD